MEEGGDGEKTDGWLAMSTHGPYKNMDGSTMMRRDANPVSADKYAVL